MSSTLGEGTGERFDRQEFVRRVAEMESVEKPAAAFHAHVVLEVVDEATTGQIVDKVYDALPDDLAELLSAGSSG